MKAERQSRDFEEKWPKYRAMIERLRCDNWDRVTPFFAFPAGVGRAVYATNAAESLYMNLRRTIKTRGSFPTEESAIKLIHMAITNAAAKGKTVQHWKRPYVRPCSLRASRLRP